MGDSPCRGRTGEPLGAKKAPAGESWGQGWQRGSVEVAPIALLSAPLPCCLILSIILDFHKTAHQPSGLLFAPIFLYVNIFLENLSHAATIPVGKDIPCSPT